MEKLPKYFYQQDAVTLGKLLLGKLLVHNIGGVELSGKIVETEAYIGKHDEAAHSFKGKKGRAEIMFKEGGYLYVYFIYGVHYCCNVVAGKYDEGEAVLIRALEPVNEKNQMFHNRFGYEEKITEKKMINVSNGPGKVCSALKIDKKHNGIDLTENLIYILDNKNLPSEDIITTTRIGISKAVNLPYRFYIKDNPYISHK